MPAGQNQVGTLDLAGGRYERSTRVCLQLLAFRMQSPMIGSCIPYKILNLAQLILTQMPNVATVLKSEISRVARKEVRGETTSLRKAVSTYRTEIAALKRRTQAVEQLLRRQIKEAPSADVEQVPEKFRFTAKGLASQRQRLGLSAEQCGRLLGASSQSIYNWEQGKTRPLARHLAAIAALRGLSRKGATARLLSEQR